MAVLARIRRPMTGWDKTTVLMVLARVAAIAVIFAVGRFAVPLLWWGETVRIPVLILITLGVFGIMNMITDLGRRRRAEATGPAE